MKLRTPAALTISILCLSLSSVSGAQATPASDANPAIPASSTSLLGSSVEIGLDADPETLPSDAYPSENRADAEKNPDFELLRKTAFPSDQTSLARSAARADQVSTQCVRARPYNVWYGMKAGRCKAAEGQKFYVFNVTKSKKIAEIDLTKVRATSGESLPTLGCVVSGASFILSLPGSPASVIGWAVKGTSVLLGAAGVYLSC